MSATIETLCERAREIVAELGLDWTVAVAPLGGQIGPCWAFWSWTITPQTRTSHGGLSGQLVVDTAIVGLDQEQADSLALQALLRLARTSWVSDTVEVRDGKLQSIRCARDEGPRQKTWAVEGAIEYMVSVRT